MKKRGCVVQPKISLFIFLEILKHTRNFKNSDLSYSNSFISGNVLNLSWLTADVTAACCMIKKKFFQQEKKCLYFKHSYAVKEGNILTLLLFSNSERL